ncbi:hypothetical protein [Proteus mirabilis]|uniref:hypothetical protein n=1 Tax=Proteus mirabilis TaxID=584 RepID=UPI00155F0C6A|nr:hypothetical protein [Proteus mirabilis]MCU9562871.1 hypothetical protein [Proteus mirabilis]MCU9582511.1 hypothetical protein [Proteus mirabilis]QKG39481.1 hypothetical protein HRD54_12010 [Proteus mirabilis]
MEFKHTPAPWRTDDWIRTGVNSESKHIAMVNYCSDVFGDEHKANAHLIAAAPELLEALIEIRKLVAHHDKADLAIAKALGQQ